MATLKITRLNKNGLGGKKLQDWGNFAEGRQIVGKPRESGYNFYTDGTKQLISGVWECTAGKVAIKNFPSDEFCILLSGSVIITDAAGKAETFGPGDAFMIPKGFNGTWNMPVTVRKYYVIFDDKMSDKLAKEKAKPAAKKPALRVIAGGKGKKRRKAA